MSMRVSVLTDQMKTAHAGPDLREWALLTGAGTLAGFASLPALWSQVEAAARAQGLVLWAFLAPQLAWTVIQVGLIVALGLFLAHRAGLGAPILEAWFAGASVGDKVRSILAPSILLGVVGAVLALVLDRLVFLPLLPGFSTIITRLGGWQGFLASFYGGILEELEMRLLILSLVAWLIGRLSHTREGNPSHAALWIAMIAAAILFALGHLPATSQSVAITPWVVVRSFVLNGGLGLLYGYLYWRRGLEAAMLSHFSSDLVIHFIQSLF